MADKEDTGVEVVAKGKGVKQTNKISSLKVRRVAAEDGAVQINDFSGSTQVDLVECQGDAVQVNTF